MADRLSVKNAGNLSASTRTPRGVEKNPSIARSRSPLANLISAATSTASLPLYSAISIPEHKKLMHTFTEALSKIVDANNNGNFASLGLISSTQNKANLQIPYLKLKKLLSAIIGQSIKKSSDAELTNLLLSVKRFMVSFSEAELAQHQKKSNKKKSFSLNIFSLGASKKYSSRLFINDDLDNLSEKDIKKLNRSKLEEQVNALANTQTLMLFLNKEKASLPNKFFPDLILHIYDLLIFTESNICFNGQDEDVLYANARDDINSLLKKCEKKLPSQSAPYNYNDRNNGSDDLERDINYIENIIDRIDNILSSKGVFSDVTKDLISENFASKIIDYFKLKLDHLEKSPQTTAKLNKAYSEGKEYANKFLNSIEILFQIYGELYSSQSKNNSSDSEPIGDYDDWEKCDDKHYNRLILKHNKFLEKEENELPNIKNLTLVSNIENKPKPLSEKSQTWK